jgi:hypothetical protein
MHGVRKYPPAEPVALRLLAPQRGLFATVRSKSKNKSKNLVLLSSLLQHRQFERTYSRNSQSSTATPAVGYQTKGLDNKARNKGHEPHLIW